MAIRRAPGGFGAGPMAGAAGGIEPGSMAGASGMGPTMPRPPMTGAPTGNGNPQAANGIPMAPPPIQPTAGGPTSPFNIEKALQTNMGDAGGMGASGGMGMPSTPGPGSDQTSEPVRRAPLAPWGAQPQNPNPTANGAMPGTAGSTGTTGTAGVTGDPTQGPLVMLRMLKAMGQL